MWSWRPSPRPGASTAATRRWRDASPTATERRAAVREHAQRDDLRRHAADPPRSGQGRLVRQRVQGQRRRRPVRRPVQRGVQGRDAQSPVGAGALRRGQHGDRRRDPRPDGHGHGRQAGLQHGRVLLCPARHAAGRPAAGRAAPAADDEGRRVRRPRLRQPHGHPDGQRRDLLRSALPGQPAGLLRHGRDPALRQELQGAQRRRLDRRDRRTHRPGRHPRGHVQFGGIDQRERNRLRRRGADRQRDHRKDAPGRPAGSSRARACTTP